mmetsp:Transcript_2730/g.4284  ORF Transcript_2730/g.4284 Transcript_2730/m.4284 type:complete len:135 (+) Transcript_2730:1202-1606(+)
MKVFDVSNKASPDMLFSDVMGVKTAFNPYIAKATSINGPPRFLLKGHVQDLQLNINMKFGQAMLPKNNKTGMSENQYNSLLNQVAILLGTLKKYLNDVTLSKGLDLNFSMGKLEPSIGFKKNHLIVYLHSDHDG